METINGPYKTECIRTTVFHPGPHKTIADMEFAASAWVDWYNNRRLHSRLDYAHLLITRRPTTRRKTLSCNPYESGTESRAVHVRIINATTGELLRELQIDLTRDYQPQQQSKARTHKT